MDVGGMAKRKKRGWRGHVVLWRGVSMCLKAQTGRVIAVWQDNNRMNNAFFWRVRQLMDGGRMQDPS